MDRPRLGVCPQLAVCFQHIVPVVSICLPTHPYTHTPTPHPNPSHPPFYPQTNIPVGRGALEILMLYTCVSTGFQNPNRGFPLSQEKHPLYENFVQLSPNIYP